MKNSIIYFAHFGCRDDGALHPHHDIMPLVHREIPDAHSTRLTPPPGDPASGEPQVTQYARHPRLHRPRRRMALPLRIVRQKHRVFSVAMEKAVATTSVGAEGIALEHDVNALLSNDPAQIARHIVELLRDPARRARIGRAGRQLVLDRYEWSANYRLLDRVFEDAVRKRR